MTLNENWEMASKRFDTFWDREIINRPCLQLYVRRKDAAREIERLTEQCCTTRRQET